MPRQEYLRASPPMFESPLVDRLTRVPVWVVPLIYVPAIAARRSCSRCSGLAWWQVLLMMGAGYVVWTLTEYWLHRIVFHFEPEHGHRAAAALDHPRRPSRPPRTTRCGS